MTVHFVSGRRVLAAACLAALMFGPAAGGDTRLPIRVAQSGVDDINRMLNGAPPAGEQRQPSPVTPQPATPPLASPPSAPAIPPAASVPSPPEGLPVPTETAELPPGSLQDLPKSIDEISAPTLPARTRSMPKPGKTVSHAGVSNQLVAVKFADGLPVLVTKTAEGTLRFLLRRRLSEVSAADAKRFDRLALSEAEVIAQLDEISKSGEIVNAADVTSLFAASVDELDRQREAGERRSGRELSDLTNYFLIRLVKPDGNAAATFADRLNTFTFVEIAYLPPLPAPPPDIAPPTPNFSIGQLMYFPSPNGLDFTYARRFSGGDGRGVTVVDIERDRRNTHEDAKAAVFDLGIRSGAQGDIDHGTAVACILTGLDDRAGVVGGAPGARFGFVSPGSGITYNLANGINTASLRLSFGDVILIEQQSWGPNSCCNPGPCGCTGPLDQTGCVPVEWNNPAVFSAIQTAVAIGITVVEPAGNGNGQNLDDATTYASTFDRTQNDSGAIFVASRTALGRRVNPSSNFGSRIDVHAQGEQVVTCGYGDLTVQGAQADRDQHYTRFFGGTSSASAIVAAGVTVVQGVAGQLPLDPLRLRQLLALTGVRNGDFNTNPNRIGTQPDLRRMLDLITSPNFAGRLSSVR
ncbi:MAG: S8 family serine peptidase [Rhizobiales bacterium]|nr:S8 family serine peptidase [Hyphomicrobiales bacterium]